MSSGLRPSGGDAETRLVYRFLDCDLVENSLFLLDRLYAQTPSNKSWIHLRSLCCLRLARYAAAHEYSQHEAIHGNHIGCAYVFAQACLELKLYRDGILVLERVLHSKIAATAERFVPDEAALSCLLGKLHRANSDLRNAADAYAQALQADAFMWDAFTDLCDMGVTLHLSNIFQPKSPFAQAPGASEIIHSPVGTVSQAGDRNEEMKSPGRMVVSSVVSPPKALSPAKRKQDAAAGALPLPLALHSNDTSPAGYLKPQWPSARSSPYLLSTRGKIGGSERLSRVILEPTSRKTRPDKRARLSQLQTPTTSQDCKKKHGYLITPDTAQIFPFTPAEIEELKPLHDLFTTIGTAYYHLQRFQPRLCLDVFSTLPTEQRETPWVLAKMARAHYEMMAYEDAKSAFQALRAASPSWVEDLEVLAATLWHLKDEVQLSYQAHDLVDSHYLSPQSWCAVGCALSLDRRPEDAIASFLRATQLRPQLARAYSLLGCEYHDCEAYDKASRAFRRALRVDVRHYPAWVGLGRVQERLGAPERALRHYLAAQKVFPDNGVVLTNIARVCDELGIPELGLQFIRRAQVSTPMRLAVFTKVQMAKLLLRVKEPEDAAEALNAALEMAPDDAEIHLLLGRTVMEAGRPDLKEVLRRFTVALSLRPHSRVIKEALDGLGSPRKTRITPWNT
ncbi:anaphase-promoting complex subunit cdc27 [Beauveria asiatica]|uniref:Anaphase-promoting complex subunit cdc27 n=1 Tax=Beauveria asiatica TaxID=1069075 RepID=A0AAW0S9P7_9HYPO